MSDFDARFDALEDRIEAVEPRVSKLEDCTARLRADIAEIKAQFPHLATRADVAQMGERLAAKIDGSINGILRDALEAEPANRARWWTAAGVMVAFGGVAVSLIALLLR